MAAMKTIRVVKLFYLALVIFALFPILAMPKPAHAATVGVYFTNVTGTVCTNNSISGTWRETADIPGPGYVYDYDVLIEKNGVIVATYVWYNDRPVGPTAGPTTVGSWAVCLVTLHKPNLISFGNG
jgi:hypothetical protein